MENQPDHHPRGVTESTVIHQLAEEGHPLPEVVLFKDEIWTAGKGRKPARCQLTRGVIAKNETRWAPMTNRAHRSARLSAEGLRKAMVSGAAREFGKELPRPHKEMTDEDLSDAIREQVNLSRNEPGRYNGERTRALAHEARERGWNLGRR